MRVIRAKILGFCMGVRRAVETAWRESTHTDAPPPACRRVYTLGPLIHNPAVLKALEGRGVRTLKEGELAPENSTVIIRAHGISPAVEAELARQGLRVLDATCPHVKLSQTKARSFAERGYRIFLAGEEDHAEIEGIRGYIEAACVSQLRAIAVSTPKEAGKAALELFREEPGAKTVLIGQTTFSSEEFRIVGAAIKEFFPDLEIVDTICGATADRQEALRELCGQVDALIIAGGRESANTRRLLSLARELGKPAWLVETPEDLPPEIFTYESVGLSAGASTPDSIIAGIEDALNACKP